MRPVARASWPAHARHGRGFRSTFRSQTDVFPPFLELQRGTADQRAARWCWAGCVGWAIRPRARRESDVRHAVLEKRDGHKVLGPSAGIKRGCRARGCGVGIGLGDRVGGSGWGSGLGDRVCGSGWGIRSGDRVYGASRSGRGRLGVKRVGKGDVAIAHADGVQMMPQLHGGEANPRRTRRWGFGVTCDSAFPPRRSRCDSPSPFIAAAACNVQTRTVGHCGRANNSGRKSRERQGNAPS